MSNQPPQQRPGGYPAYPAYPQGSTPPPPRRRRAGVIVAIVVMSVAAVVSVAVLGVALTGATVTPVSRSGGDAGATVGAEPAMDLPAGCELLPRAQVEPHLPGEIEEPDEEGPVEFGEGKTQSTCYWTTDPSYAGRNGLPLATARARAVAADSEDRARQSMEIWTGPCDESDPAYSVITVPGAQEACLVHDSYRSDGTFVESAVVVARHGTLAVEARYHHGSAPIERIDQVATMLATTVIATVLAAQ